MGSEIGRKDRSRAGESTVASRRPRSRQWLVLVGLFLLSALLAVHGPEDSASTTASGESVVLSLAIRPANIGPSAARTTVAEGHERAGHPHRPAKSLEPSGQVCLALLALTFLLIAAGVGARREHLPTGAPASAGALHREDRAYRPPEIFELSVLRL
ncbi:hypothetical protein GCM10023196_049900 [Actinoallomurus vinaceus]|uniref:Uncharacterized protein n=1 Tax=Actinoallomurus vinaceus TaxID=1080074 RepID=A0ABP8UDI1_9ACTN